MMYIPHNSVIVATCYTLPRKTGKANMVIPAETIIIVVYLGLQYKWNYLSSNNSGHT